MKRKMEDERDFILGIYFREALKSTVCNAALWKRKGEQPDQYPQKPFMQQLGESNSTELSEEEKQKAVDLFFAKEKVRRVNWRRHHQKQE